MKIYLASPFFEERKLRFYGGALEIPRGLEELRECGSGALSAAGCYR